MHVHISQCRFCAIDSSAECRYLSEISSVSNVWQSHLFCDRPKNESKRIQLLTFRFVQPISPTGMIVQIVVFIYRLCYHFPCCLPTFLLTVLPKSNIAENTDADMTISAPSLSTFRQRLIPFLPRPRFLTLSLIPVKLFPSSSGSRSDFITWATIKLHDWPTASMRQSLLRKAVVSALNLLTSLCSASCVSCKRGALPVGAAGRRSCSNRSISPARRAHSSKPAATACSGDWRMGQTDGQTHGRTSDRYKDYYAGSANKRYQKVAYGLYCEAIRYDRKCYFNMRSKADISRLNLPHKQSDVIIFSVFTVFEHEVPR